MTTTATDTPHDPWAGLPPSWLRAPGTREERARAAAAPQQSRLWQHIVLAEDRGVLAAVAREVLEAEPGVGFAFAGRLLERLRARQAAAERGAERERLHRLEAIVSRELHSLSDLLARTRALRNGTARP